MLLKDETFWFMKHGVFLLSLIYFIICTITVFYLVHTSSHAASPLFASYIYAQITVNWIIVYCTSNTDRGTEIEDGDLNFCRKCNIFQRKQSHHCPLCDCCVLRQDHHCFFLGNCIGSNNQHQFVVLVFYGAIGYLYLCYEIFTNSEITYDHWYNYFELFFPLGFITSFIKAESLLSVYLLLIFNASFTIGLFCIMMLVLQVHILCLDLTWYEFSNGRNSHRRFAFRNFVSGFGKYGLLSFIIPLPAKIFRRMPRSSHIF